MNRYNFPKNICQVTQGDSPQNVNLAGNVEGGKKYGIGLLTAEKQDPLSGVTFNF